MRRALHLVEMFRWLVLLAAQVAARFFGLVSLALCVHRGTQARGALEGVAVDPEVALATRLKALIGIARLLDAQGASARKR